MERKIGEIFNIDNEWYQVVKSNGECCKGCAFYEKGCKAKYADVGSCGTSREDWTQVIFKKLEKVGEPTMLDGRLVQKILTTGRYSCNGCCFEPSECDKADNDLCCEYEIYVEIKQTKEDMEEKKLNLKPFDIQKAREGKPVCTRDGRKARIICFDAKGDYPIVALIETGNGEKVGQYMIDGHCTDIISQCCADLMMLPEKKEGWVNVYREESNNNERLIEQTIYKTRKDAFEHACPQGYITTTKINWEE